MTHTITLQAYTKAPDGFGPGTYARIFDSERTASITLSKDIYAGDQLMIESKRGALDTALHKIRPIRLLWDSAVIFDGCIKAPEYQFRGNHRNTFKAVAVSWDKELSGITLNTGDAANYSGKTIDYIFNDLCMIANTWGITKQAQYKYDTSKLPYYDSDVFGTLLTRDYSGKTIWSAFQDLTQALDIAETLHQGEWAIKLDALQSGFYIYIIPQMLNTDIAAAKSYNYAQIGAPLNLIPDYSRLVNVCTVFGKGDLESKMTRTVETLEATTQILVETAIPTNSEYFYATNQPDPTWGQTAAVRHYLGVLISNPTGSDKTGSITVLGGDGAVPFPNELTETFYMAVPAGWSKYHFTDERYATLAGGAAHAFEVNGFSGCAISVNEMSLALSGRSINAYGAKTLTLSKSDITVQEEVNAYAINQTAMYHAPLVKADFEIKPHWIDSTDLIGKTVNMYDELEAAKTDFFCIRQEYKFIAASAHETLTLQRYNYNYEYVD